MSIIGRGCPSPRSRRSHGAQCPTPLAAVSTLVKVFASVQPMLSNSAGSHNTIADIQSATFSDKSGGVRPAVRAARRQTRSAAAAEPSSADARRAPSVDARARRARSTTAGAVRYVTWLRADGSARCRPGGAIRRASTVRVVIALRHRAARALFLPFIHPLLDAILCVDKSFTCVCHLHLLVVPGPARITEACQGLVLRATSNWGIPFQLGC